MNGDGNAPGASPKELHVLHFAYELVEGVALPSARVSGHARVLAQRLSRMIGVGHAVVVANTVRVYLEPELSPERLDFLEFAVCAMVDLDLNSTPADVWDKAPHFLKWVSIYSEDGLPAFDNPTLNFVG